MAEKGDEPRCTEKEDYSYIRTAVTLGNIEIVHDQIPYIKHDKSIVTNFILIPAAMYGQLELLNLVLEYGDLQNRDSDQLYKGWTLMHFAVEGAQRVVVMEYKGDCPDKTLSNQKQERYLSPNQPLTVEEVRWKQMDIIVTLHAKGAPITLEDSRGDTASERACRRLEDPFLEGAMLLDILAIQDSMEGKDKTAAEHNLIDTPGLSCIPSSRDWKRAIQQLVEWAYHRKEFAVLSFCHSKKYTDLSSPGLILTSGEFDLKQQRRPLFMDAIINKEFDVIKIVLTSCFSKNEVLSKLYDFSYGSTRIRETILSYACKLYLNPSSANDQDVLPGLLSKKIVGVHLTSIVLTEVDLRELPSILLHPNLKTLDVRSNSLDTFPLLEDGVDLSSLEILNISNNHFAGLPMELFQLPLLTRLIASRNKIKKLPSEMWKAPVLKNIDLSDNQIQVVPLHNPQISVLFRPYDHKHLSSFSSMQHSAHRVGPALFNRKVVLDSVRHSYINYDIDSSCNLHKGQVGFSLQTLDLSGNQLTELPRSLPCLAPLLNTLKVARNCITSLGQPSDYPPLLQTLDAQNNGITVGMCPSFELPNITCVQSQVSHAPALCSHARHWKLSNLKFLYLSGNRLVELQIELPSPSPNADNSYNESQSSLNAKSSLLFPSLQGLRISNNRLVKLPDNIHRLNKLCELSFDGNRGIEKLPNGLHLLSKLFTLKYEGISDPVVQELANFKNAPEILYYLKARECQACTNRSMRLFVIGHFHKGKTTLLRALNAPSRTSRTLNSFDLRSKRITPEPTSSLTPEELGSTVGIECGKWICSPRKKTAPRNMPAITFYTWDFAGQEEYYVTHQCFLANRALYLLVWNVEDGQKGIDSLSIWLQNMQAKAQGFSHNVVVVGTHMDKIPKHEREQKRDIWLNALKKYKTERTNSRMYPTIMGMVFVGCPPNKRKYHIDVDILNDVIYDKAFSVKAPKDFSSVAIGLNINILAEQIPQSYDLLRVRIEQLAVEAASSGSPPVMKKAEFCDKVKDIIEGEQEVETAIDFLHTTTGMALHFKKLVIQDYYIIDPQRWFDLCALVIAPDNVSTLVQVSGRHGDDKYGLLSCHIMDQEFGKHGCDVNISKLIRTFLCLFHVIHPVSRDYYLVPSAITSIPAISRHIEVGTFPRKPIFANLARLTSLPSILPLACNSQEGVQLCVTETGLIYRRSMMLPPTASGFWSQLIALFLHTNDFSKIVAEATPPILSLSPIGPAYHLRSMIGNLELSWLYWKTGIILYISEHVVLRVNCLQSHEFEDPLHESATTPSVFASRQKMLSQFMYEGVDGFQHFPAHFKEVIEVVVPEIHLKVDKNPDANNSVEPLSARLLTKALEIIDEVLKDHCDHLSSAGIYSVNDMSHVIPCPLCYGDTDQRSHGDNKQDDGHLEDSLLNPKASLRPGLIGLATGNQSRTRTSTGVDTVDAQSSLGATGPVLAESCSLFPAESIFVFTIHSCIAKTFSSDVVTCPVHGPLEIEYLAPDLVFADLVDVKLDKSKFSAQINGEDQPVARGAFGKVYRNSLETDVDGKELDVAVKVFEQPGGNITHSYADMRYELNKLSSLNHPYVVKFIGVLTNPHCFVLEWAPLKSLEHVRAEHSRQASIMCTKSIFETLLQVLSALAYLHSPNEVGIVHRDLRCSNILVFKFPELGHSCYEGGKYVGCRVHVKVTDMGICANPLAHRAGGASDGIQVYVPECLDFNATSTLTEKVDIFCLGSCLYELMTLRGLPPSDISIPEYNMMLMSGKRAQFHAKDPSYPVSMFQILEDCWQQEHFSRPSANVLCSTLKALTGIRVNNKIDILDHDKELTPLLIDSYTLHSDKRVSASNSHMTTSSFGVCLSLSTRDDLSTSVATLHYEHDLRAELQMKSLGIIKQNTVLTIHYTEDGYIFVGCADGSLFYYDRDNVKYETTPSESCNWSFPHGDIVKVFFEKATNLLIIGFSIGRIHIKNCVRGVVNSICENTNLKESCFSLCENHSLFSLECILLNAEKESSSSVTQLLEIWCGSNTDTIEVWRLPVVSSEVWTSETVEKVRQISFVRLPGCGLDTPNEASHKHSVTTMLSVGEDHTKAVVLQSFGRKATCLVTVVDVASKNCLRSFNTSQSISSVLLTNHKLVLGAFTGEVYVYESANLMDSETANNVPQCVILKAHNAQNRIYALSSLRGHIQLNGITSFFPTYVGRSTTETEKEFLVTIGFGRVCQGMSDQNLFQRPENTSGTYANVWLL